MQIRGDMALNREAHRLEWVAVYRPAGEFSRKLGITLSVMGPSLTHAQDVPISAPSESRRIAGIASNRLIEHALSAVEYGHGGVVHVVLGTQKEVVGVELLRPLGAHAL